jgi:hypothetical protein
MATQVQAVPKAWVPLAASRAPRWFWSLLVAWNLGGEENLLVKIKGSLVPVFPSWGSMPRLMEFQEQKWLPCMHNTGLFFFFLKPVMLLKHVAWWFPWALYFPSKNQTRCRKPIVTGLPTLGQSLGMSEEQGLSWLGNENMALWEVGRWAAVLPCCPHIWTLFFPCPTLVYNLDSLLWNWHP